jgi:hypothetical protein
MPLSINWKYCVVLPSWKGARQLNCILTGSILSGVRLTKLFVYFLAIGWWRLSTDSHDIYKGTTEMLSLSSGRQWMQPGPSIFKIFSTCQFQNRSTYSSEGSKEGMLNFFFIEKKEWVNHYILFSYNHTNKEQFRGMIQEGSESSCHSLSFVHTLILRLVIMKY